MLGMLGKCIIKIRFSVMIRPRKSVALIVSYVPDVICVMSKNERELGIRLLNLTGDLVYFSPSSFSVVDFSKSIELIN